mmetsp:Transcript_11419/g.13092  ORF Transcript_11419/g.13092 Transcript_11419/m.13092 type:complete len:359 (+) Transcript_11419:185-1261(+)
MLSLPRVKKQYEVFNDDYVAPISQGRSNANIPKYGDRKDYQPKTLDDFGDGGAFPEIHVAQFPLEMGRPNRRQGNVLTTTVNEKGEVEFDAIVKRDGQKVWSSASDLVEANGSKSLSLDEPSQEEKQKALDNTKAALEAIVGLKVNATKVTQLPDDGAGQSSQYITYQPSENKTTGRTGKSRVIRMVEAPVDPLELPKFKHKKIPHGPGEAPVPVMQDPPKKLTAEEQEAWKIPPCISSWKNTKGYSVPLEYKVGMDGRKLMENKVSSNFAKFAEALYLAEAEARKSVNARNELKKELANQARLQEEQKLRELAQRARQQKNEEETTYDRKSRDAIRMERKRQNLREIRQSKKSKKTN